MRSVTAKQERISDLDSEKQVKWWLKIYMSGFLIGGPHNKDYSVLGSILGSPNFGKLPYNQPNQVLILHTWWGPRRQHPATAGELGLR